MTLFSIWIILLFLLPLIGLIILLKSKKGSNKIDKKTSDEKVILNNTNKEKDYKKEYEPQMSEKEKLKEKEDTIERSELIGYVDEKLSIYKQLKDEYYKFYNPTIESMGTKTPKVLSKEVSELVGRMNKYLKTFDEVISKLQNSKAKSSDDMKEAITFACDSADVFGEELQIMTSQISSLSLRWKFLSDEEKHTFGNLRKL
jgi:hypothetical protein